MNRKLATGKPVLIGVWIGVVSLAGCATLAPRPLTQSTLKPAPATRSSKQEHDSQKPAFPIPHAESPSIPDEIELGKPAELGKADAFRIPKPIPSDVVAPIPGSGGPEIIAPEDERKTTDGPNLQLTVHVPDQVQVGSNATYRIEVVNADNSAVSDVAVEATLDEPLALPKRDGRIVRQSLGRLTAGERKEVLLTLTSDRPGHHGCQFRVFAGTKERFWKSVTVEFTERRLDVSIIGPSQRTAGSEAEFLFKLLNVSSAEMNGVRVRVTHDAALQPQEASAGVARSANQLQWKLDTLQPGEGVQLQVEYACPFPAENARLTLSVEGDNIPPEQLEARLQIVPLSGILDVRVTDLDDPVSVGESAEYTVRVENRGLHPVRDVQLQVRVPEELQFVSAQMSEDQKDTPARYQLDGDAILFDPIPNLNPDKPVVFKIQTKANQTGDVRLQASAIQAGSRHQVEVSEMTTINP